MIRKVYEDLGKNYSNIINRIKFYYDSMKETVEPIVKKVWNIYYPSNTNLIRYIAVDGGMFTKSVRTGTIYVVNAEALLYDNKLASTPVSIFSKVGVMQPGNLDKERVDELMEIGELKVALDSVDKGDLLLMDGSIKKKHEKNGSIISIESSSPLELIEELDKLKFESESDMLNYLIGVKESLLTRLVESYSDKTMWISKNSKSRDLFKKFISDIEVSDVAVLEVFSSEPGYSMPITSSINIGSMKFNIITTYIRLCKGCKVLRMDIVLKEISSFRDSIIKNIMNSLNSVSVEGYPYPLIKAHSDVKVNRDDRKRILSMLGLNTIPSAHWWPRQFL